MQGQYDKDVMLQYMREEEAKKNSESKNNNEDLKKYKVQADKATKGAQLAFEQTQNNKFEILELRKQIKRLKITSIIAILIAIVSFALTITEEMAHMATLLP